MLSLSGHRCCGSASRQSAAACRGAARPLVSLAAAPAAAPRHAQQQLGSWSGGQHSRPCAATAAGRGGSGTGRGGGSAGRSPGGRGSGRSAAGGINVKHLNSSISNCSDARVLVQLVKQHAASFDFIHASTALNRAAKLMQAPLSPDEEQCIAGLIGVVSPQLQECGAWALSNMAWALAKLNYDDPAFMRQLLRHSSNQLSRFDAQQTVNTLWALSRLGFEDKAFTQGLLKHAHTVMHDFIPQHVSNMLLAMAKLQHVAEDRQLVQQLVEVAQPQLSQFKEQELTNIAWALATLRHYDRGFMEQLLQQALSKVFAFGSQGVSNTLWALANLSHNDPAFVDAAVKRLLSLHSDDVERQQLCNTLWALSMLQHNAAAAGDTLVAAVAAKFSASPVGDAYLGQHKRQVHHYLVTMEGAGHVSARLQASAQYQQLRRDCQAAFHRRCDELRQSPHPAKAAVLQAVRQLPGCASAQLFQLTDDQDTEADVGLTLPCRTKVAVEVALQGISCMANAPDLLSGPALWRHTQLAARSFKVVVIKEVDWLEVGPEMQQMYLRMRFREAGVVLPAAS